MRVSSLFRWFDFNLNPHVMIPFGTFRIHPQGRAPRPAGTNHIQRMEEVCASWNLLRQEWASVRNRADQLFTIHISKSVVLFGVSLSVSS